MTNSLPSSGREIDVLIIGGGPAGLAAGTRLKELGVSRVVVLEREEEAGGVPRHCGHYPFGMREFKRILTGPQYAKKLVTQALKLGVEIITCVNVVGVKRDGYLLITGSEGVREISAKRIIYATGVREASRAAQMVSGVRTKGIINTGTLQQMVFLQKLKPFKSPIIVGSELVAFSAIMTCKHAKIKPVAMICEDKKVIAQWPSQYFAPFMNIALHLNTKVKNIFGKKRVEAVEIENSAGNKQIIKCDGVIFSGNFVPESSLAYLGHLEIDNASGGPKIDQYGRCSDPCFFAVGNILRPVETAGWSWAEGRRIGEIVAKDLYGYLEKPEVKIKIFTKDPMIKLFVPQEITLPLKNWSMKYVQLRFSKEAVGKLVAMSNKNIIWARRLRVKKEKRFLIPIDKIAKNNEQRGIELKFFQKNEK